MVPGKIMSVGSQVKLVVPVLTKRTAALKGRTNTTILFALNVKNLVSWSDPSCNRKILCEGVVFWAEWIHLSFKDTKHAHRGIAGGRGYSLGCFYHTPSSLSLLSLSSTTSLLFAIVPCCHCIFRVFPHLYTFYKLLAVKEAWKATLQLVFGWIDSGDL